MAKIRVVVTVVQTYHQRIVTEVEEGTEQDIYGMDDLEIHQLQQAGKLIRDSNLCEVLNVRVLGVNHD